MPVDMYEPLPGDRLDWGDFAALAPMLVSRMRIFNPVPKATSVTQQGVSNCPLLALLAAMAHADPNRLMRMVHYTGLSKPRSVWFRDRPMLKSGETLQSDHVITVRFPRRVIEVTPRIYTDSKGKPRFGFADDETSDRYGSGWVSYIEKAYVVYRCDYNYKNLELLDGRPDALSVERIVEDVAGEFDKLQLQSWTEIIGEGKRQREVRRGPTLFPDLEMRSPDPPAGMRETFDTSDSVALRREKTLNNTLKDYLERARRRPTIATTHNHTRAVLGFDFGKVKLFDPIPTHSPREPEMSFSDFKSSHDAIYQVI